MDKKLRHSPLTCVLAQIVFSPVAAISKYVPSFQDNIREQFPAFVEGKIYALNMPSLPVPGATLPVPQENTQWRFTNANEKQAFTLSTSSLSLFTNDYTSFTDFLNTLLWAVQKLHESVRLGIIERIGLRYLNTFNLSDADASRVLDPALCGLKIEHSTDYTYSMVDTIRHFEHQIDVRVRAVRTHDNALMPQEMMPFPVPVTVAEGPDVITLDIDGMATIHTQGLHLDAIRKKAEQVHDIIKGAFHKSIERTYFSEARR